MPGDLSVRYSIVTQLAPRIDPAFGITAKKGPLSSTSRLATEIVLTVETGSAGEFVLQQSAATASPGKLRE